MKLPLLAVASLPVALDFWREQMHPTIYEMLTGEREYPSPENLPSQPQHPPRLEYLEPSFWDRWWDNAFARGGGQRYTRHSLDFVQPVLRMAKKRSAKRIFFAGAGLAYEVIGCAMAGIEVVALDLSARVLEYARSNPPTDEDLFLLGGPMPEGLEGRQLSTAEIESACSLHREVGDLLDTTLHPGPFDVVVARSTVQYLYRAGKLDDAMEALAGRLAEGGLMMITNRGDVEAFLAIEGWLLRNNFEPRSLYSYPLDLSSPEGKGLAFLALSKG